MRDYRLTRPGFPVEQLTPGSTSGKGQNRNDSVVDGQGQSFQQILESRTKGAQTQPLSFSMHASQRLSDRRISMTPADEAKLEALVEKARAKGSKDALVIMDGKGFVVSVKNNTVITVLDNGQLNDSVVTNIDSAVLG